MLTEDYVSFEVAKLLREKGFGYDAEYESYYTFGGIVVYFKDRPQDLNIAPRVTLQMAMKWLREEYNYFIEIQCYGCEANEKAHFEYSYVISEFVRYVDKICTTVGLSERKAKSQFISYEQACEAAIKYCLENLI